MKIGTVTIFDTRYNYGNKLQNYAVIAIYKKLGYHTNTLLYADYNKEEKSKILIKQVINEIFGKKIFPNQYIRNRLCAFYRFERKYLNISYDLLNNKNLDKYDYFSIGSDQVWNPLWYTGIQKSAFFLTFAKPEQKVCIAPSFGLESIPEEWKNYFAEQLSTFPLLSVREATGVEIIKELTGKDAQVLIDPTLMLTDNDWRQISKKSYARKKNKNRYILKYFLGDQTKNNIDYIEYIAKKNKLEIFELYNENMPYVYEAGPREFIDLIDHADLVCTDSFHACVFSILFNKPFLVFERDGTGAGMSSRISGLLSTLGLEKRGPGCVCEDDIFEHDYRDAYIRLEKEREKIKSFLAKALNI